MMVDQKEGCVVHNDLTSDIILFNIKYSKPLYLIKVKIIPEKISQCKLITNIYQVSISCLKSVWLVDY
jgi:hypothetical protein